MAVLDVVTGCENGVQHVACDVRGVTDELGEVDVIHVVKEGGGVGVVEVIKVKVEGPKEYVVMESMARGG